MGLINQKLEVACGVQETKKTTEKTTAGPKTKTTNKLSGYSVTIEARKLFFHQTCKRA